MSNPEIQMDPTGIRGVRANFNVDVREDFVILGNTYYRVETMGARQTVYLTIEEAEALCAALGQSKSPGA